MLFYLVQLATRGWDPNRVLLPALALQPRRQKARRRALSPSAEKVKQNDNNFSVRHQSSGLQSPEIQAGVTNHQSELKLQALKKNYLERVPVHA